MKIEKRKLEFWARDTRFGASPRRPMARPARRAPKSTPRLPIFWVFLYGSSFLFLGDFQADLSPPGVLGPPLAAVIWRVQAKRRGGQEGREQTTSRNSCLYFCLIL